MTPEQVGGIVRLGQDLNHLSNEKRAPGCLGYLRDDELPSYIGIIINHYKDPY